MVSVVRSLGLTGVAGYEVKVECDLSDGLPTLTWGVGYGGEGGPEPGALGGQKIYYTFPWPASPST